MYLPNLNVKYNTVFFLILYPILTILKIWLHGVEFCTDSLLKFKFNSLEEIIKISIDLFAHGEHFLKNLKGSYEYP
jgi:hypothetical protein